MLLWLRRKATSRSSRDAATLFLLQFVQYCVVCVSYRALAQANTTVCVGVDFVYAALQFGVLRKVHQCGDHWTAWLAYALGSAAGTISGIVVSLKILGH